MLPSPIPRDLLVLVPPQKLHLPNQKKCSQTCSSPMGTSSPNLFLSWWRKHFKCDFS